KFLDHRAARRALGLWLAGRLPGQDPAAAGDRQPPGQGPRARRARSDRRRCPPLRRGPCAAARRLRGAARRDRAGARAMSEAPEPIVPGTRVGGYAIVRELGAGGMATVYEARQLSLDRRVAIKVLGAEHSADPAMVERFRREAKAAAEMVHENVVRIVDSGSTDDGAP